MTEYEGPERRRWPRRNNDTEPRWVRLVVVAFAVLALTVAAAWVLLNRRAEAASHRSGNLTAALCVMADAFRDAQANDGRIADELARLGDSFGAGVAVLTAGTPEERAALEARLRDLLEEQEKAVRIAAERPPLPPKVRAICPTTP